VSVQAGDYDCLTLRPVGTASVLGPLAFPPPGLTLYLGTAPGSVAKVTITLSAGAPVTVKPVTIGGERLFALVVGGNVAPTAWTAYDASGQQAGTGSMSSVSATKAATP
jgi:hypothetical protein